MYNWSLTYTFSIFYYMYCFLSASIKHYSLYDSSWYWLLKPRLFTVHMVHVFLLLKSRCISKVGVVCELAFEPSVYCVVIVLYHFLSRCALYYGMSQGTNFILNLYIIYIDSLFPLNYYERRGKIIAQEL